jgi:carboxylesterase type B
MTTSSNYLHFFEPWLPVIDNLVVRGQLIDIISNTSFPLKPLMIGTVTEEGRSYVYGTLSQALSPSLYSLAGSILFGSKFQEIAQRYPAEGSGDQRPLVARLVTQWVFACPTRIFARQAATYSYVFGYPLHSRGIIDASFCEGHACHGYELAFLFKAFWLNFTKADRYVSQTMAAYWTNYAKSGDSNRPNTVPRQWLNVTSGSENYLYIQNPVKIRHNYLKTDCDFWDKIGYFST